jgi:hypothetical protein
MSKVVAIMSMSLDGYVADLNDGVAEVCPISTRRPDSLRCIVDAPAWGAEASAPAALRVRVWQLTS